MTEDAFERAARVDRRSAAARAGFRIHLAVYVAVNAMLVLIWATSSHAGGGIPWPVWPAFGWGIGVIAHYFGLRSFVETSNVGDHRMTR